MAAAESPVLKLFGKTISLSQSNHSPITSSSPPPPPPPPSEEDQQHNSSATAAAKAAVGRALTCPRCKSKETKFCYFNNYNVNQPRHFCRSCHRYWTAGGALRSVPIGAGRRKSQSHHHCNLSVR